MRALHAVPWIAAGGFERARFSTPDVDMAQALNQFLTPKSYFILTTFSRSTEGCVSGFELFSPPVMLVVYPVIHVKSKNARFCCIILMCLDVRSGVFLSCFGPVDLRDETTIARNFALICAVFCMIGFAADLAPAKDVFRETTRAGTLNTIEGLATLGTLVSASTTIAENGNTPSTVPVITGALSQGSSLTPTTGPNLTSGDAAPLGDSTDLTANNVFWTTPSPGDEINFTGTYTVVQQDVDLLQ
jgi:hypothetical protein